MPDITISGHRECPPPTPTTPSVTVSWVQAVASLLLQCAGEI